MVAALVAAVFGEREVEGREKLEVALGILG